MVDDNDEDEFWQLALDHHNSEGAAFSKENQDSDSEEEELSRAITYNIPWEDPSFLSLKLSPLPDRDGIWSPLGAQAWHASSLLVAYLLEHLVPKKNTQQQEKKPSLLSRHLDAWLADDAAGHFTALELGSGAVGLSGIVMGLILARRLASSSKPKPMMILTDNEPDVLKTLQQNVGRTVDSQPDATTTEFRVQHLDWNDPSSLQNKDNNNLQLVIGSELVYTHETAQACAKVVLSILQQHINVLVFILQVTDRDGWKNVFLPTLREHENVQVLEESVDDFDLHQVAGQLIPAGGTLDRFAFGGCYVFYKAGSVAKGIDENN